jgi:hypothetical protein
MSDEPEFPIANRDIERETAVPARVEPAAADPLAVEPDLAGAPTPPPLVVIHYRSRLFPTLLLPPAFVLMAGAAIVLYRVQIADWPGLWPTPFDRQAAALASTDPALSASAGTVPGRLVVQMEANPRSLPDPAPANGAADTAAATKDGPRAEPAESAKTNRAFVSSLLAPAARRPATPGAAGSTIAALAVHAVAANAGFKPAEATDGPAPSNAAAGPARALALPPAIGFVPPGTGPMAVDPLLPPPAPRPLEAPSKEEVWGDIQRQAAQQRATRQNLEAMKPIWLEQDRRDVERRRYELWARTVHDADLDRAPFLAELRGLVERLGIHAGPQIDQLCDRYGRETLDEIDERARKAMSGPMLRMNRNQRIHELRFIGWPETLILDELTAGQAKNIAARNGPRNQDEARVRAAQLLLAAPLPPPPQDPAPAQAQPQPAPRAVVDPILKTSSPSAPAGARRPQPR